MGASPEAVKLSAHPVAKSTLPLGVFCVHVTSNSCILFHVKQFVDISDHQLTAAVYGLKQRLAAHQLGDDGCGFNRL